MKISARNQLKGTVKTTKLGSVMAEVTVEVDAGEVVAAITATKSRSSSNRPRS